MTVTIEIIDGTSIQIDEESIILIAGPYPDDVSPQTYVYTSNFKRLVTTEDGDHLSQRLPNAGSFAVLTRPDLSSVRINGSAAVSIRLALETEAPARSVVYVGKLHQAVMDDLEAARDLINAHGGHL